MKVLIFFFLIISPVISFGQLNGEYCYKGEWGIECIKFLHEQKFEYSYKDTSGIYFRSVGQGFYRFEGEELILSFETDSSKMDNIQITKTASTADSIICDISVADGLNVNPDNPMAFGSIIIFNSDKNLRRVLKTYLTDINAKCTLKFPVSNNPITFEYAGIPGYSTTLYTIVPNQNHKIKLTKVSEFLRVYKTGDIMTYKVKEIKKKSIVLTPPHVLSRFNTFVKYERKGK